MLLRCSDVVIRLAGYSNLWLNYWAEDTQKNAGGMHSIKQSNDAKPGRQRVQFGHCSATRIRNTSTIVITSANHIMAVLLPFTCSLTHQILFVLQQQTRKQRNNISLTKINFWVEYSFVLSFFSLPRLDCCFLSSDVQTRKADTWTTHPENRSSTFLRNVRTISLPYMV